MAAIPKLLLLASNTADETQLRVVQEFSKIKRSLEESELGDSIEVAHELDVYADEIVTRIRRQAPSIVHFSGHGTGEGELMLAGRGGEPRPADPEALARIFESLSSHVKCVVLNACGTKIQAEMIANYVDVVIGMSNRITDEEAQVFSFNFYSAIGGGESLAQAFEDARNAMRLYSRDAPLPQMYTRRGVEAESLKIQPRRKFGGLVVGGLLIAVGFVAALALGMSGEPNDVIQTCRYRILGDEEISNAWVQLENGELRKVPVRGGTDIVFDCPPEGSEVAIIVQFGSGEDFRWTKTTSSVGRTITTLTLDETQPGMPEGTDLASAEDQTESLAELSERCAQGEGEMCFDAALRIEFGTEGEPDLARAHELLRASCKQSYGKGCYRLARQFEEGIPELVEPSEVKAIRYFGDACELDIGEACEDLAERTEDDERSAGYLEKACELEVMTACVGFGLRYMTGRGVERDPQRARDLFLRGCEGNAGAGCLEYGRLLAEQGSSGRDPDYHQANEFFARACKLEDAEGCRELGESYHFGRPPEAADADDAKRFLVRACSLEDARGCGLLGFIYQDQKMFESAAPYTKAACEGGETSSCLSLGWMYSHGIGVGRDKERARELYDEVCQRGDGLGCHHLGFLYQSGSLEGEELDAKAVVAHERACERGNAESCYELGRRHVKGEGVAKDKELAREFYRRACLQKHPNACDLVGSPRRLSTEQAKFVELRDRCEQGEGTSCHELGQRYEANSDKAGNAAKAKQYYLTGCALGSQSACAALE